MTSAAADVRVLMRTGVVGTLPEFVGMTKDLLLIVSLNSSGFCVRTRWLRSAVYDVVDIALASMTSWKSLSVV